MATVFDAAVYILEKCGSITHMKLQKLVYYAQAWSLAWDEEPLFPDPIQAWVNGPVIPSLFRQLQGKFKVTPDDLKPGSSALLTQLQKDTVDKVLEFYGSKDPQWLSDLTHMEAPWREARQGLRPDERGNHDITPASMAEYYAGIP